jgi:hypothetical protein
LKQMQGGRKQWAGRYKGLLMTLCQDKPWLNRCPKISFLHGDPTSKDRRKVMGFDCIAKQRGGYWNRGHRLSKIHLYVY